MALAAAVQTMTGFGFVVIALALASLWLPVGVLVPVLATLSALLSASIVFKNRHQVNWAVLLKRIAPFMLVGMVAGYYAAKLLSPEHLRPMLGALVVMVASRELLRLNRITVVQSGETQSKLVNAWLLLSGVVHGLLAIGGTVLVIAVANMPLSKSEMRTTLASVWVLLNAVLIVVFTLDARMAAAMPTVAWMLPALACGLLLGEYAHRAVDERRFRQAVFASLLLVGLLLVFG